MRAAFPPSPFAPSDQRTSLALDCRSPVSGWNRHRITLAPPISYRASPAVFRSREVRSSVARHSGLMDSKGRGWIWTILGILAWRGVLRGGKWTGRQAEARACGSEATPRAHGVAGRGWPTACAGGPCAAPAEHRPTSAACAVGTQKVEGREGRATRRPRWGGAAPAPDPRNQKSSVGRRSGAHQVEVPLFRRALEPRELVVERLAGRHLRLRRSRAHAVVVAGPTEQVILADGVGRAVEAVLIVKVGGPGGGGGSGAWRRLVIGRLRIRAEELEHLGLVHCGRAPVARRAGAGCAATPARRPKIGSGRAVMAAAWLLFLVASAWERHLPLPPRRGLGVSTRLPRAPCADAGRRRLVLVAPITKPPAAGSGEAWDADELSGVRGGPNASSELVAPPLLPVSEAAGDGAGTGVDLPLLWSMVAPHTGHLGEEDRANLKLGLRVLISKVATVCGADRDWLVPAHAPPAPLIEPSFCTPDTLVVGVAVDTAPDGTARGGAAEAGA
eukprot:scaffold22311_cov197-Isochrysis_galbana.AAC.1